MADFDYTTVTSALIKAIRDGTGYPAIAGNSSGEQPAYPFCTFNFTSPEIDIERYYDGALFEMVVSLTWHGTSQIGALNLSKKTESYLRSTIGKKTLSDNGITIADILNSSSRDNFISIDYERMAGFDIRLRVRDTNVDNVDSIAGFTLN